MDHSVRASLSGRHLASYVHSSALERDLLKNASNAEAARMKFLLGFYFPPPFLIPLGASVLGGLIQGGGRRKILRLSLLFTVAPG